jgi:hypothetical protein
LVITSKKGAAMTKSRTEKAVRIGAVAGLMLALAGCTHNPLLEKWSITNCEKEADASYLDELTSNVRTSTGATTIEFRKGSILISSGPQDHTETGIRYFVQELEGDATDVRVLQARKGDPDNNDVDSCHIDLTGNTAQLESRTEMLHLAREQ